MATRLSLRLMLIVMAMLLLPFMAKASDLSAFEETAPKPAWDIPSEGVTKLAPSSLTADARANGTVEVDTTKATVCIKNDCWPALIGYDTPRGTYPLERVGISAGGYGGDVLAFKRATGARYANRNVWYAVHRVYRQRPEQRRVERLNSGRVSDRLGVSLGCVNVMPNVYDLIVDCCANGTIVLK